VAWGDTVLTFYNRYEIVTGSGFHVALGRENAKTLFGLKDDDSLRKFVQDLKISKEIKDSGRLVNCGPHWATIHCCLNDGDQSLDPAAGEFPLNNAILGGKALHRGDDYLAMLVRPDVVPFVTEALAGVKQSDFREKFNVLRSEATEEERKKEFVEVWKVMQELRVFFEDSGVNREAVLFTAELNAPAA